MTKRRYKRKKSKVNGIVLLLFIIFYLVNQVGIENITKYILAAIGAALAIVVLFRLNKKRILLASGIDIVDEMSGRRFEEFLMMHFRERGYRVQLTPISNDYGADLILKSKGVKTVVQAKRWSNNVGIEAVQQVVGAINYYGADKGMVITNSYFTQQAIKLAQSNNIELWDRKRLICFLGKNSGRWIGEANFDHEAEVRNTCPSCGSKLVIRSGKRGRFWGCSGYPECRFTRDLQ